MNKLDKTELDKLSKSFQEILTWKWDTRFQTVLSEFSIDKKDMLYKILGKILPNIWNNTNLDNAHYDIKIITKHFGGLMPGQIFFTANPNCDILTFCAWWPWGNGKTISIRIAQSYKNLSDAEKTEQNLELKKYFGLQ